MARTSNTIAVQTTVNVGVSVLIDDKPVRLTPEVTKAVYDLVADAQKPVNAAKAKAKAKKSDSTPLADVRAWAFENGYEVKKRGQISKEIKAAYAAAHKS